MKGITPVIFLWGSDPGGVRAALGQVRKLVLDEIGEASAAFNHDRFEGPRTAAMAQVLNACAQVPMMAPRRLVELSSPDEFGKHAPDESRGSSRDAAMEALIAYFADPNPTTVLVLHSTGLKGTSKLVKAAKKAKAVTERRYEPMAERDAVSELGAMAKRMGLQLARPAAAVLVEAVGSSRAELDPALARIRDYVEGAGLGTRVGVDVVWAVVSPSREIDVFALTDAIARKDARTALRLLARAFAVGEKDTSAAMRLLGMLGWQIRRLLVAKSSPDPAKALGIKPFAVDKLCQQAASFSEEELARAHAGLAKLDSDFKGGSKLAYELPYLALQRWVLDVCDALPGVPARL